MLLHVPVMVDVLVMRKGDLSSMERYVIHVTKECNCDCLYCYEKDKTSKYTWDEIKEFIDNIIKFRTSNEFGIEFLGGEPMLAWDYIRKSYEYLEANPEVNIPSYIITTNGTIIDEESADYISKNKKFVFAISLDGHLHANQLRVFKNSRKNTYDTVMNTIEFLRKYGVEACIHMVTHPYNVAYISDSIEHLYRKGIRNIDIGTVESTILIDEDYCNRFIKELDIVSQKIVSGEYKDLRIGLFEWLKPYTDIRTYIKDPKTGKTIGESYGRSGDDVTSTNNYAIQKCTEKSKISEMIYFIRKTVYDNHKKRVKEALK